mmetsp:Transcript_10048/g.15316  ORF Transcript_10048/g.15316 Transcript_10048/m.15316 type:complete len:95 (+) Transcript_10048:275-559(+)
MSRQDLKAVLQQMSDERGERMPEFLDRVDDVFDEDQDRLEFFNEIAKRSSELEGDFSNTNKMFSFTVNKQDLEKKLSVINMDVPLTKNVSSSSA